MFRTSRQYLINMQYQKFNFAFLGLSYINIVVLTIVYQLFICESWLLMHPIIVSWLFIQQKMDSNNSINSNNWSENQMDVSKNNLSTADVKGKENELFDGLPIDEVYKIAIKYYKGFLFIWKFVNLYLRYALEKERAGELPLEYPLRLQFLAHSKQAKYGSFVDDVADYGWYDLISNIK